MKFWLFFGNLRIRFFKLLITRYSMLKNMESVNIKYKNEMNINQY